MMTHSFFDILIILCFMCLNIPYVQSYQMLPVHSNQNRDRIDSYRIQNGPHPNRRTQNQAPPSACLVSE